MRHGALLTGSWARGLHIELDLETYTFPNLVHRGDRKLIRVPWSIHKLYEGIEDLVHFVAA